MRQGGCRRWVWVFLAVLSISCSGEDGPEKVINGEPPGTPRTSPENLMQILLDAYADRDLTALDSLFSPDYAFVYVPDEGLDPDTLDRADEHLIHLNLFGVQYVQELELTFDMGQAAVDDERTQPGDTVWTAVATNVQLRVLGTTPDHPTVTENFEVRDARQQYWFTKMPWTEPVSGEVTWAICEWHDLDTLWEGLPRRGAARTTWSAIKSIYR